MAAVGESGPQPDSDDPYAQLGLSAGASFEQVQSAKQRCLTDSDDDPQAKARIEAAYDAVLMARLRDRQQGQLSPAAATASQREDGTAAAAASAPAAVGVLQRIRSGLPDPGPALSGLAPEWSLVEGRGLIVRLIAGGLGLALLLVSPGSVQLILALAVIGCFLSQIRRGRRPLASLGWTLLLLIAGLVSGVVLVSALSPSALSQLQLSGDQIQAIPAALLLLIASLLLA